MPNQSFNSKFNKLYITHVTSSHLYQQFRTTTHSNHTGNNTFSYTPPSSNYNSTCYTSNATIGSLIG